MIKTENTANPDTSPARALREMVEKTLNGRAKKLTSAIEDYIDDIEFLLRKRHTYQEIADQLNKTKGVVKENGEPITAKNLKYALFGIRQKAKRKAKAKPTLTSSVGKPHSAPATAPAPAARAASAHISPALEAIKTAAKEKREVGDDENSSGPISARQRKGEEIAERYSTTPVNPLAQSFLKKQSQERSRD